MKLLDAIADDKEFMMASHRIAGIVDPHDQIDLIFAKDLKIKGRAGGDEISQKGGGNALNATAARVLNTIIPEEMNDKFDVIYQLMKSMQFNVSKESVNRNIKRKSSTDEK